jgi:hypothetical protein
MQGGLYIQILQQGLDSTHSVVINYNIVVFYSRSTSVCDMGQEVDRCSPVRLSAPHHSLNIFKGILCPSYPGFSPLYQFLPHPYLLYIILYINNHLISSLLSLFLSPPSSLFLSPPSHLQVRTDERFLWCVTVAYVTVASRLPSIGAGAQTLTVAFSSLYHRAVRTA